MPNLELSAPAASGLHKRQRRECLNEYSGIGHGSEVSILGSSCDIRVNFVPDNIDNISMPSQQVFPVSVLSHIEIEL